MKNTVSLLPPPPPPPSRRSSSVCRSRVRRREHPTIVHRTSTCPPGCNSGWSTSISPQSQSGFSSSTSERNPSFSLVRTGRSSDQAASDSQRAIRDPYWSNANLSLEMATWLQRDLEDKCPFRPVLRTVEVSEIVHRQLRPSIPQSGVSPWNLIPTGTQQRIRRGALRFGSVVDREVRRVKRIFEREVDCHCSQGKGHSVKQTESLRPTRVHVFRATRPRARARKEKEEAWRPLTTPRNPYRQKWPRQGCVRRRYV